MTSIVKKIQVSVVVLVFIYILLQASDYMTLVNKRPAVHNHLIGILSRRTKGTTPDSAAYVGMKMLTIPRIQISVNNIAGSTYTGNTILTKGHPNNESVLRLDVTTSHVKDVSVTTEKLPSRTQKMTLKLDQQISRVQEAPPLLQKPPIRANDTGTAKISTIINNSTMKTNLPLSYVNVTLKEQLISGVKETRLESEKQNVNQNSRDLVKPTSETSLQLDITTSSVDETVVKLAEAIFGNSKTKVDIDKLNSGGNGTSVKSEKTASGVNVTSVRLDKATSDINETSVRLDKATSGVNETSVRLDKATFDINETTVRLDMATSGVNETSVRLDKATYGVTKTPVRLEKATSGVNETSVRLDKATYGATETPVRLEKATSGVNETSVRLDKGTSGVNETSVRLQKATSGVNDTSVRLDKITSHVTSEQSSDSQADNWTNFQYPLDVDMVALVQRLKSNKSIDQKPVFPYTYTFSYHRIDRCEKDPPFFIFLIKSALTNIKNRAAIRDTWAHSKLQKKYNFVRLFFVGSSENKTSISAFKKESSKYKDIVQVSFRDNYYNNTLKTIGAIHWTVTHCNRSKFVVFVDDDMLVSTKALYHYMRQKVSGQTFFGGHINAQYPQRRKADKWYVSYKDYPHKQYPPMPSGGFLIMTMNFVIDLHHASQYTKKFIYDDCYLAILSYKLHVTPVDISTVYMWPIHANHRLLRSSIAVHGYEPDLLRHVWHLLNRGDHKHGRKTKSKF